MKKSVQSILIFVFSIALLLIGLLLFKNKVIDYAILLFVISFICFIIGILSLRKSTNPDDIYDKRVKSIINTYDSVLVKSSSVPNFEDRNIVTLSNIDDLIDAQLELRKPICYLKQTESCSFVLLDDKDAYVYIMKINDNVTSPVEIELKAVEVRRRKKEDMDSEILKDIEKTTIVKLSNMKSYKISPIRKKEIEVLEWLDDTDSSKKDTEKFQFTESDKVENNKKESIFSKNNKDVDVL